MAHILFPNRTMLGLYKKYHFENVVWKITFSTQLGQLHTVLALIIWQNETQIQVGTQEYMVCDWKRDETLGNYDDQLEYAME